MAQAVFLSQLRILRGIKLALRVGAENNLVLFSLVLGITAVLVLLERITLWVLARYIGQ
jgi:hypothetical protein